MGLQIPGFVKREWEFKVDGVDTLRCMVKVKAEWANGVQEG
jgi:peroxiredoxin